MVGLSSITMCGKNAVVFETYQGDELRYAAIVGTDSPDLSETKVCYPEGSTPLKLFLGMEREY